MNTLNIAICEDLPTDAALLQRIIAQSGVPCRVFQYENGEAFLSAFQPDFFQLILLDVYLDGAPNAPRTNAATGIEVAQQIRAADSRVWLAFTTVSHDHAAQGYKVQADRYLVKPLEETEVHSLLQRAALHFEHTQREITITVERLSRHIRTSDIMYVEALGKKSLIHTPSTTLSTYTKINTLAEMLNFMPFLRCHRSFIVNLDFVASAQRDFTMTNGDTVYISRNLQWKMREAYRSYIVRIATEGDL